MELSSGARVVVLEVAEFEDVPHICKRDNQRVLVKGHIYVRPRGKPQSVAVPSSDETRQLLDVAIDKGVRDFVRRAGAAGVPLMSPATAAPVLDQAAVERDLPEVWPKTWRRILDVPATDQPPTSTSLSHPAPSSRTASGNRVCVIS